MYVGAPLAVVGAVAWLAAARGSRPVRNAGAVLLASWALYVFVFHYLANLPMDDLHLGVQARFHMQGHIALCTAVGVGAHALAVLVAARVWPAAPTAIPQRADTPRTGSARARKAAAAATDAPVERPVVAASTAARVRIAVWVLTLGALVLVAAMCAALLAVWRPYMC
jgi:hypothetical protein